MLELKSLESCPGDFGGRGFPSLPRPTYFNPTYSYCTPVDLSWRLLSGSKGSNALKVTDTKFAKSCSVVVKPGSLTPRNPVRSMRYRADRHPTYTPNNTRGGRSWPRRTHRSAPTRPSANSPLRPSSKPKSPRPRSPAGAPQPLPSMRPSKRAGTWMGRRRT